MAPKKTFTGHLGDLLEPLPPVDPGVRTPVNIRRSKPFKTAPTRDLDVFFTPSPSQSSLTARPRGKQMMPSSSTVVQQPSKIPHRRVPIVEPPPPPPPPTAAKESQESIVPDSEPERRANTCNSSAVEEKSVPEAAPSLPLQTGFRMSDRRVIISSDDDDLSPPPTRSPRKRMVFQSSDDEEEEKPPPRRKAVTLSISPKKVTSKRVPTEVIIISDSEDDNHHKPPGTSATQEHLSLPDPRAVYGAIEIDPVANNASIQSRPPQTGLDFFAVSIISEEEIVPDSQDAVNWSDSDAELGYSSPRSLKKTSNSIIPTAWSFRGVFPSGPSSSRSAEGFEVRIQAATKPDALPDEITEGSPCKVPLAARAVRSMVDDSEVLIISSDESDDSLPPTPPPTVPTKAKPKSKAISRTKLDEVATPTPKTKKALKGKGPATPTSPTGKISKVAKARLLDHYAQELFDDLNEHVFGGVLKECELVWSKLLSSTAGKAFLRKERDANGATKTRSDGSTVYSLKIELSTKVVDCEERVRNTLSHEMCHLSTWLVDGPGQSDHGAAWKKWAAKVSRYRRDIEISTRHTYEIAYKYSWKCSNASCGHIYGRFSKSIDITKQGCGVCRALLEPLFETKTTKTSPWQDFMKQHLKTIKAENPGISQSAAMQLLSEKWKQSKTSSDGLELENMVAGLGKLTV